MVTPALYANTTGAILTERSAFGAVFGQIRGGLKQAGEKT
jgi:hypothetical protein